MYTSCTAVHMIKNSGCLYLHQYFTGVSYGQQRTDESNILWQTWVGAWVPPGHSTGLCCTVVCCSWLCGAVRPTVWTSAPIIFQTSLRLVLEQGKSKCEPSVRCYKLLARPVARPREPDLAAPRLRRVKRCTQRSSLHLYAPYIGRLLLQPTGTWLLAS